MKKRLLALLCAVMITAACCVSAFASPARLIDEADLLTPEEESRIAAQLDDVSSAYGLDVVAITKNSLGGVSPQRYADDTLDQAGYDPNAILLLVSMETRDVYISTAGSAISVFSDRALEDILDDVIYYLSRGDNDAAFWIYGETAAAYLSRQAGENIPVSSGFDYMRAGLISLVIGLIAALIVTLIMKGKLKSVRKQSGAKDYVIPGSMNLTHSRDMYLYSHVSRRAKPQQKSGSSTHFSAGGVSHGGRGGRF